MASMDKMSRSSKVPGEVESIFQKWGEFYVD